MSILDPVSENIELTQEQKTLKAKSILTRMISDYRSMVDSKHRDIFRFFWNNNLTTPNQLLQLYGNEAYLIFQLSSDVQTLLGKLPGYKPLVPPKEYTINPDGTASVEE